MLRRMGTTDVAAAGGIFQRLGDVVVRWPLLVIGFWIALAAALFLTLPPLQVVAAQHQVEALPADAPVVVTGKQMAEAFHETGSGSMLLVVLTDEKGLGPADEKTYRALVDKLRQDTKDVQTVQDFLGTPQLREVLQSKDNKAWALPVVLNGDAGTPQAALAYQHAGEIVKKTVANSTLTANLTGPAATTADLVDIGERDLHVIEVGITIMVLLILLIVYRNPVTMLIPLITIGVSVATAQGVLAGLGELGLGITGETIVFMTGVNVRRRNGLRRLPDQPLSRLRAAGRGFGSSGEEGFDIHRQSDRRLGGHRGGHLPRDDLHAIAEFHDRRPGVGDLSRSRGVPLPR